MPLISDPQSTSDNAGASASSDRPAHVSASEAELSRRLARKEQVLRLLKDVALAMNEASSVDEALQYVLDRICAFTGWPVGHAYLLAPGRDDLLVSGSIFHFDEPEQFRAFKEATVDTRFRKGVGLPGRVMASHQPEWVTDVSGDPNFPRARLVEDIGVTSGFAFPVVVGEDVKGILEFFSSRPAEPDHDLIEALTNVGAQLGRAIEREQAAEAIRASEEHLRALTRSTVEALITANERGRIEGWAGGAGRMFGYSAEEVMGQDLVTLMPERHTEDHRRGMARYRETGEARILGHTIEIEARHKDGSEFPIELSLSTWEAGGERFFTAVIRDITERKRAEDDLRDRERQLGRAQRIAQLGSWQFELGDSALTWSDELYRIYGLEPGREITYEEYVELLHPDDREHVQAVVEEALETHEPYSFSHRLIRRTDGEERVLQCEGEVVVDGEGRPVRMFGTALDVTDLKRTEENLRERERLFRLLAENMTDMILLQDRSGVILYASPSCERLLGRNPAELEGRDLFPMIHPEDRERLRTDAYQEMLNTKKYTEVVVRVARKSGEYVWLETASKPILDADGAVRHILSSARDVSERIQAEQEAARYRGELEKRNRELQDFAYVASHDLQEPLRKIRAFSDLLEEDYGDVLAEEALGYIDRVKDAATRMSTLISDLLQFSRITTRGEPFEVVDLNDVVTGVMSDLEIAVEEADAEVEIGDLPEIQADAMQMRQLFQNLLSNALKFSQDGQRPHVSVTASVIRKRIPSRAGPTPVCRIVVSDNGIGFDPKHADRIFTPFQRLHHQREFEGTGMGLAICRRIVERHDGTIAVDSGVDEGATFTIELPVSQS